VAVTGGASGIGEAIARKFALHGAGVFIVDISLERAGAVAKAIHDEGGSASVVLCDVASMDGVRTAFQKPLARGRLDILVNCAGIAHIANLESTSEEDFDKVFRVNVKGVFNCMQACIGHMKQHGGGAILNMASIAATAGVADRFAYSMSKGAVLSMTLSVAKDYLADGIRCNCISPARVHTPFVDHFIQTNYPGREKEMFEFLSKAQPIGRMLKPDEVASLALFLCSDEAAMVTGSDYPLDGGFFNLHG
jgi:2-keto-3-deoxy-L-fuconate dehydrogenase